jgi:hypothetical protein
MAVEALLDGIPESMVIGLSPIGGGAVSMVAVVVIFISNIPEGLSSSAGMKKDCPSLPTSGFSGYLFAARLESKLKSQAQKALNIVCASGERHRQTRRYGPPSISCAHGQ